MTTLLTDILTPQRIKVPLVATTKHGVIEELVDLLVDNGDLEDRDRPLQAVLRREQTRTTGVGHGLAIPHGKCDATRDLVMAMGRPKKPVDFDSVDGKPVTLLVLLIGPTAKTGRNVQVLAQISRLMSAGAFRSELEAAETARDIFRLIQNHERQP